MKEYRGMWGFMGQRRGFRLNAFLILTKKMSFLRTAIETFLTETGWAKDSRYPILDKT